MENLIDEKKKPFNFFQRFLLVVVIPTMFALVVFILLLVYTGTDVMKKGKELAEYIPFLSSETANKEQIIKENKNTIAELEKKITDQQTNIESLEKKLENSDKNTQAVNLEKDKLQRELDALKESQEETKKVFEDIVKTYETMTPKKSASIISEMSEREGMKILASLKPAKLALILEKMEPAIASKYTELLSNSSESSNVQNNNSTDSETNE
jgi:flagellar motility protein MotE (MotC chaperone)